MPKPKTDPRYEEIIGSLAEEGLKPPKILELVEKIAEAAGWTDAPHLRTVQRLYGDYLKLPLEVRREQGLFRWPRTMELGLLPWDASRSVLDLLRYRDQQGLPRPTVRVAKWYWRIRLASPGIPIQRAEKWAALYATIEFAQLIGHKVDEFDVSAEWMLAYEPWSSEDNAKAYASTAERRQLSGYAENVITSILPRDPKVLRYTLESRFGKAAASKIEGDQDV